MDGVDGDRAWRMAAAPASDLDPADTSPVERQHRAWNLIDQANAAIRHARHHLDVSAQLIDHSHVLLLSCERQVQSIAQALNGHHRITDSARYPQHRGHPDNVQSPRTPSDLHTPPSKQLLAVPPPASRSPDKTP